MNSISRIPPGPQRAVVEVLAEHERPHDVVNLFLKFLSTCNAARLDPGVALPLAALRDEIVLQEIQAADKRPRLAVRPQPHVDAEGKAVLGALRQQPDEDLSGALVALVVVDAAGVHENQVDVGGNIEFPPAQLPHSDNHQVV